MTATAPTGRIRAARLASSPRLQRTLAALREAGPSGLTTWEIIHRAKVCAVSTCVDELNDPINGFSITSKREAGNVWRYRLHETQPADGPNPGDSHPVISASSKPQPVPGAAKAAAHAGSATETATGGVAGELPEATHPPEPAAQLALWES